jgi:serpin B
LQRIKVILSIQKFTFETQFGLKDILSDMGLKSPFDPTVADFSAMDGQRDIFINDAIHKAFNTVNEKGMEEAAATVIFLGMGTSMPQGVVLTIDRPSFFFIRDVPSGTILIMERIVDPR